MLDFRKYIRDKIINPNDRILEFGPLNRPIVTKDQYKNAYYSDIRNSDEIKKLYTSNDYLKSTGIDVDLDTIVDIDYVVNDTYKRTFKNVEKFDAVILGHVIEHIPDIISFFLDVPNVINKNGKLIIIYPDARYCFDHFRNGTTFIDAYDVYENSENSSKRVFDFVFNVVHENNASLFWGDKGLNKLIPRNNFKESITALQKAKKNELPDDTHFWPFADYQFIKFLYDMDRAGLLNFEIESFYPTQENTQEFMIILKPKDKPEINYKKYIKLLDEVSFATKEIRYKEVYEITQNEINALNSENKQLKKELSQIYNSKKWKYAHTIGKLKNSVLGNDGKK
jgi:hypothetical protein